MTPLQKAQERAREAICDYKGKDGPLKLDFFDRRVDKFTKSLDGKWIYCLTYDDEDEETNYYPLANLIDYLYRHDEDLIARTRKEAFEEAIAGMPRPRDVNRGQMEPEDYCENGGYNQALSTMSSILQALRDEKAGGTV